MTSILMILLMTWTVALWLAVHPVYRLIPVPVDRPEIKGGRS